MTPEHVAAKAPESQRDSGSKPRVARNELPWGTGHEDSNPDGVVANLTRLQNENGIATTALRLMICSTMTQGSSFLATLGWRTQSLWDWAYRSRHRRIGFTENSEEP